jgi:SepF-like predicted cell division protein (DUF552 family)
MNLVSRFIDSPGASSEEYAKIDETDLDTPVQESGTTLYTARIEGQKDMMDVKDALYDEEIVIADTSRLERSDITEERVFNELKKIIQDINGDIVERQTGELILTPRDVSISRTQL